MKTAEEILIETEDKWMSKNGYPDSKGVKDIALLAMHEFADQFKSKWISVGDKSPEVGEKVLIIIDVRKWDVDRKRRVECAYVGNFDTPTKIGGPNALTGYSIIKGIYFSVPAILHPESVTHWMPLPELPKVTEHESI